MNCAVLRNTDKKSKAEEERVLVPALPCPWLSHHQGLRPLHTQASVRVTARTECQKSSGYSSLSVKWVLGCLWASGLGGMALGLWLGLLLTPVLVTN